MNVETYSIIFIHNKAEETIMAGLDDETANDAIVGIHNGMVKEGKFPKCLLDIDDEENYTIYAEDHQFNEFCYEIRRENSELEKSLKKAGLI